MDTIICFFKGHKPVERTKQVERFVRYGETTPQYETQTDIFCERCGKWQHPYTYDWVSAV